MSLRVLLIAAAAFVVSVPAVTQSSPSSAPPAGDVGQVRKACAIDIKTYCGDVQPGGGRIGQCIRQNLEKLSEDCRSALKAMRAARRSQ